jgi:UPF0716 protein FxsA
MLGYLILLFTVLPALELILLIKVGTIIGAWQTVALVILIGSTGALLARCQGFLTLMRIQESLNRGVMPSAELMDGMMILTGGVMLLTPGFITDIFGILLLFPLSRAFIKFLARRKFQSMIAQGTAMHYGASHFRHGRFGNYEDFDVKS